MTVARFRAVLELMERIVDENTDLFIGRGQAYRAKRRGGTDRRLSAVEAASMAATAIQQGVGESEDLSEIALTLQQSELRQQDLPGETEVLIAAGVATAPAFFGAVTKLVALVEMPADQFENAYETDTLNLAVDEAARHLDHEDMAKARPRAVAALEHFGEAAGQDSGKAIGMLVRTALASLTEAMTHMRDDSTLTSLTGWPESTGGPDTSASTESTGERPST